MPATVTYPAGGRERSVPPQSLLHGTADRLSGVVVLRVGETKPSRTAAYSPTGKALWHIAESVLS